MEKGGNPLQFRSYTEKVSYQYVALPSFVVNPKIALDLVNTRDEIYNNLNFAGGGGSERVPVVRKNRLTPTLGLTLGYNLSRAVQFNLGVEDFDQTGDDAAPWGRAALRRLGPV